MGVARWAVEIDREGRGAAGGALTVMRFRPFGRALLPWAVAAVMLFGGGLAAQAQSLTPEAPKCTVSGTTVTCTGDLSPRVDVDGGSGTYTKLIVIDLTDDIVLKEGQSIRAVEFTSEGDIDITIDTGDFRIATTDGCRDCGGVSASSSNDGVVTVRVTGVITISGQFNEGISAVSDGDNEDDGGVVTVEMTGKIVAEGSDIEGIYALSATDRVKVTMDGNITVSGGNSWGIYAQTDGRDAGDTVTVDVTGDITVNGIGGKGIFARADTGNIGITLHGGIIDATANGIEFFGGPTGTGVFNTLRINNAVTISGETFDVLGGTGDEKIDNYGTLTTRGTIDLGAGANSFNNMAGATFNSGTAVVLGSNNRFSNWGDLSPGGASIVQETTLTGAFISEQGSTFTVTTGPNGSDKLTVTDAASLGGTVRVLGAYEGTYTILDAARISLTENEFDDIIGSLFMTFVQKNVDSNTDNVDDTVTLEITRNSITIVEATGVTGSANQRAVANALDSLEDTDSNNPNVRAVLGLNTAEEVRAASDAISGEVHASLKGALTETGQRRVAAVNRRLAARSGNPDAQSSDARTSTAAFGNLSSRADRDSGSWITGYGAWGETDATPGTARMETDLRGVLFGVDRALGDHWRLGVLGGYSRTDVTQRARLSSASVDTWSAGLYGGAEAGAWGLDFGAIYNGHAVDTSRTVSFTNDSPERLSARYDARSWQLFAEAGHKVQVGGLMLEPFAGVFHTGLASDGFSESGGDAALTSSSDTDNTTFTTLGMHGAMVLLDTVHVRGMAGWRHAFGDTDPSSTHTLSGSSPFTVTGAPTAEDAVVTEFGIEASLSDNAFLGVAYKGQYGDGAAAHGFNAGLRVTF